MLGLPLVSSREIAHALFDLADDLVGLNGNGNGAAISEVNYRSFNISMPPDAIIIIRATSCLLPIELTED